MEDLEQPSPAAGGKLILGLGNPGSRFLETRHNLGFRVVEELARRRHLTLEAVECQSRVGRDERVTLAMPQTYMNRSGSAARCLVERHGFRPGEVLVVYDDLHLPLGRLRLRRGGSPGGHRGLESIVENLRTDRVPRLRLGIAGATPAPPGRAQVELVLSPFTPAEEETAGEMVRRAAEACAVWLEDGVEVAMNRFNG